MKTKVILLLAQNTGVEIADYLSKQQADEIVGVYLSMEDHEIDQKITKASKVNPDRVFSYQLLSDQQHLDWLRQEKIDFIISVYWPYIIKHDVLALANGNAINCHPSFLPYNRGSFPHIFVLLEGTPCGVTLHQLTAQLDAGPIWAQKQVEVFPQDTALSLYERLQSEMVDLFKEFWPLISSGKVASYPQDESKATMHRVSDVKALNRINLDSKYTGREWINLLRARSLGDLGFAYFEENGKRIYLNLRLGVNEDFKK